MGRTIPGPKVGSGDVSGDGYGYYIVGFESVLGWRGYGAYRDDGLTFDRLIMAHLSESRFSECLIEHISFNARLEPPVESFL